jgi:ABC-type multidrug transport system fused ATPase/permease subunit
MNDVIALAKPKVVSTKIQALLRQLFEYISQRRRYQTFLLLILTLFSSLAEIMSLGAVVPFIAILTQPEQVLVFPVIGEFVKIWGITTADELILPIAVIFAGAAVIAGSFRLLLLWVGIRLIKSVGADLSIEVYRRTLYQPFRVHVARNSNEVISGVIQKVDLATGVLMSVVTLVTSLMLFTAILITLLVIDPIVASTAAFTFGIFYVLIAWFSRKKLSNNGKQIAHNQTQVIKSLQEGLGAIRDIILDSSQTIYCAVYGKSITQLQRADCENTFINQAPRYFMEMVGLVLVSGLAYSLSYKSSDIATSLPVLGALALGAQKLLPLLQKIYGSWATMKGGQAALVDVLELLDQPLPTYIADDVIPPYDFKDSIRLKNIKFRYSDESAWVLDGINLSIPKGARIGFIGSTGSGKSTTLDLIMSLLDPTEGKLLVDEKEVSSTEVHQWQKNIAHVPQSIFLADCSIAENIAIGIDPTLIDMERVRLAAEQSQISKFIDTLPEKYFTDVGERGVRLSGGQRQRIGIARALYKKAKVIVFDEATSALDSGTETAVMNAIESLNRNITILIIAHRLTTLRSCDRIIKLEHGKIVEQGSYDLFNQ